MSLAIYQRDYARCIEQAAAMLGGPVRALVLPWDAEERLRKRLQPRVHAGLGASPALMQINDGRGAPEVFTGIVDYRLPLADREVHIVRVVLPYNRSGYHLPDFWAIADADYSIVCRYARRVVRRSARTTVPVMSEAQRERLWQNTIGFLRSNDATFRKYRIAKKRGVLLSGEPGNGKTMACRWLQAECHRLKLRWRNVTVSDYRTACSEERVSHLFYLDRPGIVLFDDFDVGIRHRGAEGASADHSTFLAELDGVTCRRGIVYLFTSNANLSDLDPAFRRPGRIDVVLEFSRPNRALRARFIRDFWTTECREAIDEAYVVGATDGLSFADLEELRKLLVLQFLESQRWDWARAWGTFAEGRGPAAGGRPIGFGAPSAQAPAIANPVVEVPLGEPVTATGGGSRPGDRATGRRVRRARTPRA